ncbi:MAG TPA: nucleoside hydrolase [Acidimicrobiia bacterium]|jgi:inosine-uridine nucleoside N-ribohydrolase
MPVPVVIDTDIGSDVDDALAIALAVRHPELELRAVTTVSSQPDVRAGLAAALLDAACASHVPVAVGRSVAGDDRNVIGAEHAGRLVPSSQAPYEDAVELLAGVAPDTAIATIGQQTNLAAAVRRDPRLARRARELTVMGGSFAPFRTPDGQVHGAERDWNLVLDPTGAVESLAQGWRRLRYVPIDVTFRTVLTRGHVDRLRDGDDLCRLLADLLDGWRARVHPSAPPGFAALLHDPLAVACVAECAYVHVERLPVTVMLDDRGLAHTVVDPVEGRAADVVRSVDAPAFADWMVETLLSPQTMELSR